MKNANDLMPASRMFLNAVWIFCRSSRLIMSLRTSSDSDSMPSGEHPAAGLPEAVDERRIGQVVGARVAEPLDRQVARDELVAERRERLDVERDRVAPQVEEVHAELAVCLLDLVDQDLGAALPELVALVDGRDAEIARVRTPAAGLDEHVWLVHHRERVVLEGEQIPRRATASAEMP